MRVVERAYVMCNDKLLCYNNDGLPITLKTKEVVRMNNNNSLSHTTWNCKYHIVFAPKYRRKVAYGKLREDIRNQLQEDLEYDQMTIKEYVDPFTGEPVKRNN